ncbi:MAG: hypothetical protein AAFR70_15210, partial [Pseudomonadota bacterium]
LPVLHQPLPELPRAGAPTAENGQGIGKGADHFRRMADTSNRDGQTKLSRARRKRLGIANNDERRQGGGRAINPGKERDVGPNAGGITGREGNGKHGTASLYARG